MKDDMPHISIIIKPIAWNSRSAVTSVLSFPLPKLHGGRDPDEWSFQTELASEWRSAEISANETVRAPRPWRL